MRLGSNVVVAVAQTSAAALIRPLELPYVIGAAVKRKKKKHRGNGQVESELPLRAQTVFYSSVSPMLCPWPWPLPAQSIC